MFCPQVVTTIEGMVTAANEMEIDNGERLEAILIPYEDLPDFQEILLENDWEPADKLDVRTSFVSDYHAFDNACVPCMCTACMHLAPSTMMLKCAATAF